MLSSGGDESVKSPLASLAVPAVAVTVGGRYDIVQLIEIQELRNGS